MKKLIFKKVDLSKTDSPLSGEVVVGFNNLVFSQKDENGVITPIGGGGSISGTINVIPKISISGTTDSQISDDGSSVFIGSSIQITQQGYFVNTTEVLLSLYRPTNNIGWGTGLQIKIDDSNNNPVTYANISAVISDNTSGAHSGELNFYTYHLGNQYLRCKMSSLGLLTLDNLSGIGDRLVESDTNGVISATKNIINTYGIPNTEKLKLENPSNWTGVNYTGSPIIGTYQGQRHYDGSYLYDAVGDNIFIRLIRG